MQTLLQALRFGFRPRSMDLEQISAHCWSMEQLPWRILRRPVGRFFVFRRCKKSSLLEVMLRGGWVFSDLQLLEQKAFGCLMHRWPVKHHGLPSFGIPRASARSDRSVWRRSGLLSALAQESLGRGALESQSYQQGRVPARTWTAETEENPEALWFTNSQKAQVPKLTNWWSLCCC